MTWTQGNLRISDSLGEHSTSTETLLAEVPTWPDSCRTVYGLEMKIIADRVDIGREGYLSRKWASLFSLGPLNLHTVSFSAPRVPDDFQPGPSDGFTVPSVRKVQIKSGIGETALEFCQHAIPHAILEINTRFPKVKHLVAQHAIMDFHTEIFRFDPASIGDGIMIMAIVAAVMYQRTRVRNITSGIFSMDMPDGDWPDKGYDGALDFKLTDNHKRKITLDFSWSHAPVKPLVEIMVSRRPTSKLARFAF